MTYIAVGVVGFVLIGIGLNIEDIAGPSLGASAAGVVSFFVGIGLFALALATL